ncbi:MAG: hypothetical protein IPP74_03545 [Alphaproteobacteria bacterium]|nr:hypothetical protein [Alphaproteobacteria bacterium]
MSQENDKQAKSSGTPQKIFPLSAVQKLMDAMKDWGVTNATIGEDPFKKTKQLQLVFNSDIQAKRFALNYQIPLQHASNRIAIGETKCGYIFAELKIATPDNNHNLFQKLRVELEGNYHPLTDAVPIPSALPMGYDNATSPPKKWTQASQQGSHPIPTTMYTGIPQPKIHPLEPLEAVQQGSKRIKPRSTSYQDHVRNSNGESHGFSK